MSHYSNLKSDNIASEAELNSYAQHCLDYLVSEPEELSRFMANSGYSPDTIRQSLETKEFDMAMMSYFAGNEAMLLAMCANANINANHFMRCWNQQNAHI